MDLEVEVRVALMDQPQHGRAAGTGRRSGSRRACSAPVKGARTASASSISAPRRGQHPAPGPRAARPAGESSTLRVVRSMSWTPRASSSAATAPERAGWLMPMAAAASRKCRCSATAAKARSCARLGVRGALALRALMLLATAPWVCALDHGRGTGLTGY